MNKKGHIGGAPRAMFSLLTIAGALLMSACPVELATNSPTTNSPNANNNWWLLM